MADEHKKTISSIFLAPTLGVKLSILKDNGYIAAFTQDFYRLDDDYENVVYLLFKPKDIEAFKIFLDNEYKRTSVIEDYDYIGGYVVVIYGLDPTYQKDFDKIKKGEYSKTSIEFQALFPEYVTINKNKTNTNVHSIQYKIFNKTSDLAKYWYEKLGSYLDPEFELWETFIPETETLNIDNYGN